MRKKSTSSSSVHKSITTNSLVEEASLYFEIVLSIYFINIKMLQVRVKANSSNPIYFPISETASVKDLKIQIEKYVHVPLSRQEILTPERTLSDKDTILEISGLNADSDDDEGNGAISLYDRNAFVGFIRIISEAERKIHEILDGEAALSSESNLVDGLFQPIESLNDMMSTVDSDEILELTKTLKRGRDSSHQTSDEDEPNISAKQPRNDACGMNQCKIKQSPKQCFADICQMGQESCKLSHNMENSGKTAPYVDILPENRRFMLVISTACKPKCYCSLLNRYFEQFSEYRSPGKLRFNEVSPVATYDGRLYVAPADDDTMEWVLEKAACIGDPFVIESLLDFLKLNRCTVVWPRVVDVCDPSEELVAIFKLLEAQNCGVNTAKWSVIDRTIMDESSADYMSGAVTNICPNEKVELYIDDESAELIRDNCNQLRYCFWILVFVFCE